MKGKIITVLIILFTTITGCSSVQTESPDINSSDEYKNLLVKGIGSDILANTISFKVENTSTETMTTGLSYTIEKYENKKWNKTKLTDDLVINEIALLINPNETIEEEFDMSHIVPLKDGSYRIKKSYYSKDNVINQYIEFEVKNKDIIDFSNYNTINKENK